jgi:hypothetical protein
MAQYDPDMLVLLGHLVARALGKWSSAAVGRFPAFLHF